MAQVSTNRLTPKYENCKPMWVSVVRGNSVAINSIGKLGGALPSVLLTVEEAKVLVEMLEKAIAQVPEK